MAVFGLVSDCCFIRRHQSYVRPAMLYGSEVWCQKEYVMCILQSTEKYMVRVMCGVQLKDRS